ncbi:MAG: KTSC domain-containing protein [Gaiellaceae bacterium]
MPQLVFLQLLRAESMGAFFNERIRDRYRCEGPL